MLREFRARAGVKVGRTLAEVVNAVGQRCYWPLESSLRKAQLAVLSKVASKRYVVEATGHGSGFVRENPPKLQTLADARAEAARWCSLADTIGGTARVVDYLTNQVVHVA